MAKQLFERPIGDQYDQIVFMSAFAFGLAGILITRIIGDYSADPAKPLVLTDFLAVLISIAVIFLYTLIMVRASDRAGLSLDRAGDNAYYLGLLFTLVSLSYSLYKVAEIVSGSGGMQVDGASTLRSSDRVVRLLPDFGLALASTITGIFCRVLVQQLRGDSSDTEAQARQELSQAVWELRASLMRAVADINSLSQSANTATTEMVVHINKTLEKAAETNASTITSVGKRFEELTQEIASQLAGLDIDPADIRGRLSALSDELGKLQSHVSRTSDAQKKFAEVSETVSARIASSFSPEIASSLRSASENTIRKQEQLLFHLDGIETRISNIMEDVSKTGEELTQAGEASRQALDSTVTASSEYVESLADAAEKLRRSVDEKK